MAPSSQSVEPPQNRGRFTLYRPDNFYSKFFILLLNF